MKNIEIKAKYPNLKRAEEIAVRLGAQFQWRRKQLDTYFKVPNGRLKLREVEGESTELIGYFRPDIDESKKSRYEIVFLEHGEELRRILCASLGVVAVVSKTRTLYLHANVRIHLDEVDGLGNFVEFEGVLEEGEDEGKTRKLMEDMQEQFEITQIDLVATSYGDLLLQVDGL
jgi:predicted adenylyl cyclase CyaB